MSLCLVSALLKVITDAFVYWVALRGINYLIIEYKRNAELALQDQGSCEPIEKKSVTKWKVLVALIFLVSFIESIFITVVRLSFYFSSQETHLLLMILGALIYGPLTKLTQFAGFIVLVIQQFKR